MTSTAAHFGETKRRGITVSVNETKTDGGIKVARFIAACIREKQKNGQRFVLGLATGSSPIGVYQELVRLHKEEGLSFANVASYNLDEYYPMEATHKESYHRFMSENLFSHIDIDQTDVHIPDGTLDRDDVDAHCKAYEEDLRAASVDVQLLGIGRDGHIGFNEPGSTRDTVTRKITLNEITREDAAPSFDGIDNVPTHALTMGVDSILQAKCVVLVAWGSVKAPVVKQALTENMTADVSASFLQDHANAVMVLDKESASLL